MGARTHGFNNCLTTHLGMIIELVASLWTDMNATVQAGSALLHINIGYVVLRDRLTMVVHIHRLDILCRNPPLVVIVRAFADAVHISQVARRGADDFL